MAELVHNKIIDGISDYHTDLKDGVKITITLKKDANPQVVLNNLYKHTNFQITYGITFLMIDDMTPKTLGLKGNNDDELFNSLIEAIEELKKEVEVPASIKDAGVKEEDFLASLDEMSEKAFDDQCTGCNPRYPLISEIKDLYLKCYYGK